MMGGMVLLVCAHVGGLSGNFQPNFSMSTALVVCGLP